MISEELKAYGRARFQERKRYLDRLPERIEERLAACEPEAEAWMRLLYGTMPIRDMGEYGFDIFLSYVTHSLWLREHASWCADLPETVFAHYVLYYRVNSEDIRDCRRFFYDCLEERIRGMTMKEAILEINYWCAEQVAYEASDERTLGPLGVYRGGKGRCGEESTFTVTALRSVGIPARQVYVPRWAHCDDNHAWVEVYAEDGWHFLGACEPEEILDRGWFLGASSRTLLVQSRTFFNHDPDRSLEHGGCGRDRREGMLWLHNSTALYTDTAVLTCLVKDREGRPVGNAGVEIQVLNMAEWVSCASLLTDRQGRASIELGLGDVRVRAHKGEDFGWKKASLWTLGENAAKKGAAAGKETVTERSLSVEISLEHSVTEPKTWADGVWSSEEIKAPAEAEMPRDRPSREQRARQKERTEKAGRLRRAREKAWREEAACKTPDMQDILHISGGNHREMTHFMQKALSVQEREERMALLKSLAPKDYRDADAELLEHFLPFRGNILSGPRIGWEELSDYPAFIRNYFDREQQEQFRKQPQEIWSFIENHMAYDEEQNYSTLLSTPGGALITGQANRESRNILFVAICRSLGIPARKNPVTGHAEYQRGELFVPAAEEAAREPEEAVLYLHSSCWERLRYLQTWTVGKWQDGEFVTLHYEDRVWREPVERLGLEPGIYRVITANRMPNGSQQSEEITLCLQAGEEAHVTMALKEGAMEDMLVGSAIEDFILMDESGAGHELSRILKGEGGVLAFLEEGAEPTEHILNEWRAAADSWNKAEIPLIWVVRSRQALENPTLQKTCAMLRKLQIYFDPDWENAEPMARKMYVNPEGLPLAVLVGRGLRGMYGSSGYNVGSVELIYKLWKETGQERHGKKEKDT